MPHFLDFARVRIDEAARLVICKAHRRCRPRPSSAQDTSALIPLLPDGKHVWSRKVRGMRAGGSREAGGTYEAVAQRPVVEQPQPQLLPAEHVLDPGLFHLARQLSDGYVRVSPQRHQLLGLPPRTQVKTSSPHSSCAGMHKGRVEARGSITGARAWPRGGWRNRPCPMRTCRFLSLCRAAASKPASPGARAGLRLAREEGGADAKPPWPPP